MKTLEQEHDFGAFRNKETFGFIFSLQNYPILHKLAGIFVNKTAVAVGEAGQLVNAMEFLANAGGKVDSEASPAWRMSIEMGGAADCFTKVSETVVTEWLNEEFELDIRENLAP
jgi:hypothetical protein